MRAAFKEAYLASFLIAASTIFRSRGTVSSNQRRVFVDKENITISGRDLVSTKDWPGMVELPKKSKFICQSEAFFVSRMEQGALGR